MRFSLRRQLLLIGLITLALPWVSALYVRETESALRDAQAGFLADLARGLAPQVNDALSAPPPGEADEAIFLHPLVAAPTLDGFNDDWRLNIGARAAVVGGERLQILGAVYADVIWLYAALDTPPDTLPAFELTCLQADGALLISPLRPEAPGLFSARLTDDANVRGNWQPGTHRSRLELRIPAGRCQQRIGLAATIDGIESRTYRGSMPGALITHSEALTNALERNPLPGIQAYVVNRFGWRVTPIIGSRSEVGASAPRESFSTSLYRRLLGSNEQSPYFDSENIEVTAPPIQVALKGQAQQSRASIDGLDYLDARSIALAAQPLRHNGTVNGALVLQQDSAAILTLTNPSLVRLTNSIIAITALVVIILLAYATWISWRVRRLAQAARSALDNRGRLKLEMPGDKASDEIGDLTRGFETLLSRVAEQQSWLQTMADKLSHELRTPIAVVQSSLDNLQHSGLDEQQQTLSTRASDGVQRLRAILNAMSSANRAEQAARDAIKEPLDLSELVHQLSDAYAQTFSEHIIEKEIQDGIVINGAAELIVQMLDKLVENAVQFSAKGNPITLRLNASDDAITLNVINIGPSLPPGDPARLFQTFVSHRPEDADNSHLGFGLYIARLIAEAHEGKISAVDVEIDDVAEVRISVRMKRTAV